MKEYLGLYSRRIAASDVVFFFQAEDGIRGHKVTGVQTCALPILASGRPREAASVSDELVDVPSPIDLKSIKIGRASCREREKMLGEAGRRKKKSIEDTRKGRGGSTITNGANVEDDKKSELEL